MAIDRLKILALAAFALLAVPGLAAAQNFGSSPTVSPYLNLLNSDQFGNPIPATYQALVQPLIKQRESALANHDAISRLNRQVSSGGVGGSSSAAPGSRGNYHNRYLNFGHYYPGMAAGTR